MEIVKKNILSIICGVVAILAIVASFVPLGSYASELQGKLDKSKSNAESLSGLLSKQRSKPILSPDSATAEPLGTFPNDAVIAAGKITTGKVEAESQRMRDRAEKMNVHSPLVPGSLPQPNAGIDIVYRESYTKLFTPGINGELPPVIKSTQGHPPLKPTTPPSELRLTQAKFEADAKIRAENEAKGPGGQVTNAAYVNDLLAQMQRELPEKLRQEAANTGLVYVDPVSLQMNRQMATLPPGSRPEARTIWWSQVQLWVQQDVLNAIADMNAGKTSVLDAPVKHLFNVSVLETFTGQPGSTPGVAMTDPLAGNPDGALTKVPTMSLTGRTSNALYDVIYFDMTIDVEASQLANFIRMMSNKRLMFVRELTINSVDSAGELAKGYYYGPNPVAHAVLHCEELLMRKWATPLMPATVKQVLGVTDQPPAGGAVPMTPTAMAQ